MRTATLARQKQAFARVVRLEDAGVSPLTAMRKAAKELGLSFATVADACQRAIDEDDELWPWPPLPEAAERVQTVWGVIPMRSVEASA